MKKVTFLVVVAVAFCMASCTAQSPKGNLKTDIDSLSYAFGMANTQGIEQFYMQQGIDSTNMVEFLQGFNKGADQVVGESNAYLAGVQLGMMVGKQWIEGLNKELFGDDAEMKVNRDKVLAGFIAGVLKKEDVMPMMIAQGYSQTKRNEIKQRVIEEKYAENKAAGEKFLAENKEKEGVVTLPSGLQYKVITEGKGAIPQKIDHVKVHYKGTLIDGTEFDSSYKRKDKDGNSKPAEFRVNQVIQGWTEALTMMPVGSKWEIYIPQELAYGASNRNAIIKPFSTLVFEVELIDIVKDKK